VEWPTILTIGMVYNDRPAEVSSKDCIKGCAEETRKTKYETMFFYISHQVSVSYDGRCVWVFLEFQCDPLGDSFKYKSSIK